MPQIFKALASITAWVLFVFGLLALLTAFVRIFRAGTGTSPSVALMWAYFGSAIASLFLSVVTMKLRKTLE